MVNEANQQFGSNVSPQIGGTLPEKVKPEDAVEQFPGGQSILPEERPTLRERAVQAVAGSKPAQAIGKLGQAAKGVGQAVIEDVRDVTGAPRQTELTEEQFIQKFPQTQQTRVSDQQLAEAGVPMQTEAPLEGTEGLGVPQRLVTTAAGVVQQPEPPSIQPFEVGSPEFSADVSDMKVQDQISQAFVGELKSLSDRGVKLDKDQIASIYSGFVDQFKNKFFTEESLKKGFTDANKGILEAAGVNSMDELIVKFNKQVDRNTSLANLGGVELGKQLASGTITEQALDTIKNTNPNVYNEAIQTRNQIATSNQRNNDLKGTPGKDSIGFEMPTAEDQIAKSAREQSEVNAFMGGANNINSLYDTLVKEPLSPLLSEKKTLENEADGLQEELDNIESQLREEFGTVLVEGTLNQLIRDRQASVTEKLQTVQNSINNLNSNLQSEIDLNQAKFDAVISDRESIWNKQRKDAQHQLNVDKFSWSKKRDSLKMQFDQEKRQYANNLDLAEKFLISDLPPAQANALVGKMAQMGGNYVLSPAADGSYYFINKFNPSDVQRYQLPAISSTPIGNNVQTGANNWSSVATSFGQVNAFQPIPGGRGSTIGSGTSTLIGGPMAIQGRDIAGPKGSPITAPLSGFITEFGTDKTANNFLRLTTSDGITLTFNHLDGIPENVKQMLDQGMPVPVAPGDLIAMMGNSGNVISGGEKLRWNGKVLNQERLDAGDGSHLDLVGKITEDGVERRLTMPELIEYVQTGLLPGQRAVPQTQDISMLIDNQSLDSTINMLTSGFDQDRSNKLSQNYRNLIMSNDVEGLQRFMNNLVVTSFSATEKATYNNKTNISAGLKNLQVLLKEAESNGFNTNLYQGTVEEATRRIGMERGPLTDLDNQILVWMDFLTREQTGAALNDQELQFYKRLFPGIGKTAELNDILINSLSSVLDQNTIGMVELDLRRHLGDDLYNEIYGLGNTQFRQFQQEFDLTNQIIDQNNNAAAGISGTDPLSNHINNILTQGQFSNINP